MKVDGGNLALSTILLCVGTCIVLLGFTFVAADKDMAAPLAVGLFLSDPIGIWGSIVVRGLMLIFLIPLIIIFLFLAWSLFMNLKNKFMKWGRNKYYNDHYDE